jgi:hypothetical protein
MSRNINLYDPALRLRRDPLGFEAALAWTGAALACVAIAAAGVRWSVAAIEPIAVGVAAELDGQRAAAQALATQAASIKPDTALQSDIAAAQRTLLQRRAALQTLGGDLPDRGDGFSSRLEALARQSVDGLWLTGMVLHRTDVLLKGRTLTPSLIPVYVQRLDREPSLQGNGFKALDVQRPVEVAANATTPAAAGVDAAAASTPPRAAFVEFTLVGNGATDALPIAKETRP